MADLAAPTHDDIMASLRRVKDPELRQDLVTLNMVRDIQIDAAGAVSIAIDLTTPGCPLKRQIEADIQQTVGAVPGVAQVQVTFGVMSQQQKDALRDQLRGGREYRDPGLAIPDSCRVIAVSSGKGGVGKSTVTANLAAAMAARGHEVGLIDADVYGYSIPQMLGIHQRPVSFDNMIVPPVNHGVRLMSIGFFLDEDEPVMWRGPMLHRAIQQFLGDVHWGDIEYLFVDMPPGTGDIAISLAQLLPRAEVLVVTTPQTAAQVVARRAAMMAERLDQHLLGVVENMSAPEGMDPAAAIFGAGGGALLASQVEAPLLGSVPLDIAVREGGDTGAPAVLGSTPVASAFADIAETIAGMTPPAVPAPVPTGAERIKKSLTVL